VSTRLQIAIVQGQFGMGGAERQTFELARRLDRERYLVRCLVLSPEVEPYGPQLESIGIEVRALARRGVWDVTRARRLRQTLHEWGSQIVYAVGHGTASQCLLALWPRQQVVLVPSIRSTVVRHPFPKPWLYRWMFRRAPRTIVNSFQGARFCQTAFGLPASQTEVIPNGIDLTELRQRSVGFEATRRELAIAPDQPLIVFVGKDSWQKNPRRYFELAAQLVARHPELHAVALGGGLAAVDRARWGVTHERIHLLGPRDDAACWIRAASCLVLSSDSEGCPNVVLEAAALGTPVVASDVGDVPVICRGSAAQRVVPRRELERYIAAVEQVLRGGASEEAITERLAQQVASEYAMEQMIHRTEAVFEAIRPDRRSDA
jgi:glycosyltransferase involved in cell wall biosynthesis